MNKALRRLRSAFVVVTTLVTAVMAVLVVATPQASGAAGAVPVPGTVGLYGDACTSSTICYAVGELQLPGTIGGAIVTVTSGHAGKPKVVSGANGLYAVSCPSVANCYAVGFNSDADGVVVHFSGSSESSVAVPSVDAFTGIDCVSATVCYAVGTNHIQHNQKGSYVVTTRDGQVVHESFVATLATPFGIACGSTSSCDAVGAAPSVSPGGPGAVVTVIKGIPVKTRTTKTNYFDGVACASSTTCYAGTSAGGHGAVVTLKGGVPGAAHTVVSASQLGAVACANSTTCVAVGAFYDRLGAGHGAVVKLTDGVPGKATWNGTANFSAVSCSSGGACVAVGTNSDMTEGYLATAKI